nr:antibiotic biosynthesis monooxygenase [Bacillus benzoevorans]
MGTYEYLKTLKDTYPHEDFLFLQNENTCLLLHETESDSLFKSPKKYEVIDGAGTLSVHEGYAVLHYIPVTDEGRPIFEYRFNTLSAQLVKVPGFDTARVLRPLSSDTYIILTVWKNAADFKKWQSGELFNKAFSNNQTKVKSDKKLPQIFPRSSYMTRYSVEKE